MKRRETEVNKEQTKMRTIMKQKEMKTKTKEA